MLFSFLISRGNKFHPEAPLKQKLWVVAPSIQPCNIILPFLLSLDRICDRYSGSFESRTLLTMMRVLYTINWLNVSQPSWSYREVLSDRGGAPQTILAALFCNIWTPCFEIFKKILKNSKFWNQNILKNSKFWIFQNILRTDRPTDLPTDRPTGPTYIGHLPWPKNSGYWVKK